jgi:L-ascorbate metabolism protein UlaG (beta-lactamase superfamily)
MAEARIEYVGHATVLIDMDGVRVLTDPLLRNRVAHLRRAGKVDAGALRGLDAVLISHLHYDHLDFPSLQRLGADVPVLCPRGAGALIRRKAGVKHVLETSVGEDVRIGGLAVTPTPADHDSGRLPWGVHVDPLGFVLRGSRSIYFAGDTDLFDGMSEIGPVEVALVPIWGWGPALGAGHMDPQRAAASLPLLRPAVAIPIHWGTYFPLHLGLRGVPAFVEEPPAAFVRDAAALAPEVEVRVLRPGHGTTV